MTRSLEDKVGIVTGGSRGNLLTHGHNAWPYAWP